MSTLLPLWIGRTLTEDLASFAVIFTAHTENILVDLLKGVEHDGSRDHSGQVVAVWICVKWMVSHSFPIQFLFCSYEYQLCLLLLGSICSRLGKVLGRNEMKFSH